MILIYYEVFCRSLPNIIKKTNMTTPKNTPITAPPTNMGGNVSNKAKTSFISESYSNHIPYLESYYYRS